MSKTVIVGGGVTGLATAYYLREFGVGAAGCTLVEGSSRVGGKVTSMEESGFLVEGGPDSFLAQKQIAKDLCVDLGLEDELIGSNSTQKTSTYVLSGGHLHPMPQGMMLMAPTMILPILRSRLISWPGKLRMGLELLVRRRREQHDESLASFVRRRLGREVLDKIAAPLMAGIHAADPERLSLQSTFPMFAEMEQAHGSLLLAMFRRKRVQAGHGAKRGSMFLSLAGGVQRMTDALAARLEPQQIRLNSRVRYVTRDNDRYRIEMVDGSFLHADNIVFATPAYVTAEIIESLDPLLAKRLRAIRYASTATVSLGFRRSELNCELQGLGFIVPASELRRINACTWSSTKFSQRAPEDCVLMRVFIGGALSEELAEQDEASLIELARQELGEILGITATPVLAKAYRWHKASPQYDVNHQALVRELEQIAAMHPGLYLAGAAYRGAGIPDCLTQARDTALKIARAEARGSCEAVAGTQTFEENVHVHS